jgi:cell wall-associated NlpC family hydrolase
VTYEDLLLVPYKENGRDENGMDCYGLVIELFRRSGRELKDIAYVYSIPREELFDYVTSFGANERPYPSAGFIAQWQYQGLLHIGYMVSKKLCVHMTFSGVQVVPIESIPGVSFFEV